jgi:ABC-type sugar transport system permease subunit
MTKLTDTLLEMPVLKHSRLMLDRSPRLYTWLTIGPVLIWVAVLTVFPFAYAAYLSTHKYHLIQPDHPFVGARNYIRVIGDELFVIAGGNTLLFTAVSAILVIVVGLGVALLLNNQLRGFGVLRALVLLPWAIPLVSAGILWKLMLHGNFGAVNGLLLQFGFIDHYMTFFSRMPHAFISVIFAHIWREFPLATILFLAGLQTIPPEYYDAAKVDGAGRFARFWHVTLPSLRGTLLIVLVYETMIGLAVFDLVYVLTGGGPGTGTTLAAWLVWTTTFKSLNLGRGAALSFIIAIVLGALVLVFLRMLRIEEEASS